MFPYLLSCIVPYGMMPWRRKSMTEWKRWCRDSREWREREQNSSQIRERRTSIVVERKSVSNSSSDELSQSSCFSTKFSLVLSSWFRTCVLKKETQQHSSSPSLNKRQVLRNLNQPLSNLSILSWWFSMTSHHRVCLPPFACQLVWCVEKLYVGVFFIYATRRTVLEVLHSTDNSRREILNEPKCVSTFDEGGDCLSQETTNGKREDALSFPLVVCCWFEF